MVSYIIIYKLLIYCKYKILLNTNTNYFDLFSVNGINKNEKVLNIKYSGL